MVRMGVVCQFFFEFVLTYIYCIIVNRLLWIYGFCVIVLGNNCWDRVVVRLNLNTLRVDVCPAANIKHDLHRVILEITRELQQQN